MYGLVCVGYLVDAFDLLNIRYLDAIADARGRCDRLVVGVLDDDECERLTGRRPIITCHERIALIAALRGVDQALPHHPLLPAAVGAELIMAIDGSSVPHGLQPIMIEGTRDTEAIMVRSALTYDLAASA